MNNTIITDSDIYVSLYIQKYITLNNMQYNKLPSCYTSNFSKEDFTKMQRGQYIFNLKDFNYLIQCFKISPSEIFEFIAKHKHGSYN